MLNSNKNNQVQLIGTVIEKPAISHTAYNKTFYSFVLSTPRLSGTTDYISVMASKSLAIVTNLNVGDIIEVTGQFRSYNRKNENKKIVLSVFADSLCRTNKCTSSEDSNSIYLDGFVCKTPLYRITPSGKKIADITLAVNRQNAQCKSDYIPVVLWGKNAELCRQARIGDNIRLWGRIQSRVYYKFLASGEKKEETAYEISGFQLEIGENNQSQFKLKETGKFDYLLKEFNKCRKNNDSAGQK